jgi:hypothetical protein
MSYEVGIIRPMVVLASSAVKQSHHEALDFLFLPLIWENREEGTACS